MINVRLGIRLFFAVLFLSPPAFSQDQKIFSFGIIADVQYADVDQAGKRHYRGSLEKLENSIEVLNQHDLSFMVSLGDLIDRNYESFEKPLQLMAASEERIHHVLGNHDFSVEDGLKKTVPELLDNRKGYYSFDKENFKMIILNGMAESTAAYSVGSKKHKKGKENLARLKSMGANNAQSWNGGLDKKQRRWLERKLKKAAKNGKKVILFCHFPLLPENGLQLWGNKEVLKLVNQSGSAVAWFSGHHHSGNYVQENNIHHLTFKGMVEATSDISCAIVDVYEDRLVISGFGDQEDRILKFGL